VQAVENSGSNRDQKYCADTCAVFVTHFDISKGTSITLKRVFMEEVQGAETNNCRD
jgi:hypothetical protein